MIAERYVQALLELAENDKDVINFGNFLKDISDTFSSNNEFKKLLSNPCISNEEKLSVITELFPDFSYSIVFVNFLKLILENGRINIINSIYEDFVKISNEINNELNIKIIVSNSLDDSQINDIVQKYKRIYNANKVNYSIVLDKSIIGGIKVIVGNTVYDNSLKTQLENIF